MIGMRYIIGADGIPYGPFVDIKPEEDTMTQTQRTRLAELERTPKAALARLHVANGGQMGLPVYLKWSKDELVRIVAEDEGIDPWSA